MTERWTAWEIADQMAHAFDPETGEVDQALWEELALDLGDKAEAIHAVLLRLEAEASECDGRASVFADEQARLKARAEARRNEAKRLRSYFMDCLHKIGKESVKTPTLTIYRQRGRERVDVTDIKALLKSAPHLVKVEHKPIKADALRALKSDKDGTIRGAVISRGPDNLVFK